MRQQQSSLSVLTQLTASSTMIILFSSEWEFISWILHKALKDMIRAEMVCLVWWQLVRMTVSAKWISCNCSEWFQMSRQLRPQAWKKCEESDNSKVWTIQYPLIFLFHQIQYWMEMKGFFLGTETVGLCQRNPKLPNTQTSPGYF